MENLVGRASAIWLNQFRPIQIFSYPPPHEMAKALHQNGFIFIFMVDKNKICLKETQSSYLINVFCG